MIAAKKKKTCEDPFLLHCWQIKYNYKCSIHHLSNVFRFDRTFNETIYLRKIKFNFPSGLHQLR